MGAYSIVLADDHTVIRQGLKKLICELPSVKVVAEANDGLELLDIFKNTQPDLVVVDITMPNFGGLEAAREIVLRYPETKVMILTMHKRPEYLRQALSFGVHGYLLKENSGSELHEAIKAIRDGKKYITQRITSEPDNDPTGGPQQNILPEETELSSREKQVLYYVARGKSSREIASELFISHRTIEAHRANIMKKLKLKNRTDLIKYAIRKGIAK